MQPSKNKDDFVLEAISRGLYHVASNGDIVSHYRGKCRILTQSIMEDGYCRVGIAIDGVVKYVKAHRVVALALIENPENKPFVNHRNSIRNHNDPSNLEWVTTQENTDHMISVGRKNALKGNYCPSSKVSELDVLEIRRLYNVGNKSQREIGELFGIKQNTVSSIILGTNWKNIEA